jgi:hypothetical protein
MSERRTFIIRVHSDGAPIHEDVATDERVPLPNLASLACELRRRLHDGIADAARDPRDSPGWDAREATVTIA